MIDVGAPVTVETRGGTLRWERLHLPARKHETSSGVRTIEQATESCALHWRSLCGLPCWLYAYAGAIVELGLPFCSVCVERAKR